MSWLSWWKRWRVRRLDEPEHLRRGRMGEEAAAEELCRRGWKHLTSNYRGPRGEIDLVFRDGEFLVFVEVKTRSSEAWVRPAAAVDAGKRRRLNHTAHHYLRRLQNPQVKWRFDVVEVLLEDGFVREVRVLIHAFERLSPGR